MTAWLDVCRFTPTAGGTTNWTYSAAVTGYQSPSAANAVNGVVYRYRAESADLSQWEVGYGAYNSSTGVLSRTTILFSSNSNAIVNFSVVPQVAIVALAEDLTSLIPRSYLAGLTLSTAGSSATFGIAVGAATDSTNADVMTLASAFTKTTSAWAVGTGNGALDTGTIAASTWYHAYLIKNPSTGAVDILVSLSVSSPSLPSGYTLFRRVGSMKTDASSHWLSFTQNGDEFLWVAGYNDAANIGIGATSTTATLAGVPMGLKFNALLNFYFTSSTSSAGLLVNSLDMSDAGIGSGSGANASFVSGASGTAGLVNVRTNTSAQIRVTCNASSNYYITTFGWIDRRGRDN